MQGDILNVQGIDAEDILEEMNFARQRLALSFLPIKKQELASQIETWELILQESGHQVEMTPKGYDFKRRRQTGPLPAINLDGSVAKKFELRKWSG